MTELGVATRKRKGRAPEPAYRYVFIIAYGRSGSTVLQSMLNTPAGVCIRGENYGALYWIYRTATAAKWTRKVHSEWSAEADKPWFGAGKVRSARLARQMARSFVRNVLCPPEGTLVTGCKEVRFFDLGGEMAAFIDFLRGVFPNARFVFCVRDRDDVVQSAWWSIVPRGSANALIDRYNAMAAALASAPDSIVMNSSSLSSDPARCRALFEFLELPYDERAVTAVLAKRLTHARKARYTGIEKWWRP